MAMMDWVHVLFRPFRDELSLTRDDDMVGQKGKRAFRRKFGETPIWRVPLPVLGTPLPKTPRKI